MPALTGQGLPEAWQLIEAYAAHTQATGYWPQRRAQQQLQWLDEAVREGLAAQFYGRAGVQQAVAEGRLTPWAAAGDLLETA